jgi:flagellar biosynthesis protein FlhG
MHSNNISQQSLSSSSIKINIIGGASGVGKTLIALKMALEYSRMGKKTLLIDCDVNSRNSSTKLGLTRIGEFKKLLTGEVSFDDVIFKKQNFHLLVADGSFFKDKDQDFEKIIIDIVKTHEREFDFIIIESPPLEKHYFLNLNEICDHRLIVIAPEKKSLTDSYSFVKLMSQKFGKKENFLFVNKYQNEKQFLKVATSLTETIENFLGVRTQILGGMPKFNFDDNGFDTFFLSGSKNEINHNFVKLLLGLTEEAVGSRDTQKKSVGYVTNEQDVH